MSRFQLGARVSISGTAVKRKTWAPNYSRIKVTYEEGPPPSRTYYPNNRIFTEGVVVGSRTIQDGEAFWEDATSYYQPDSGTARNVWLVAFDLRMKPALCFDHQVDAAEPEPCGHAALVNGCGGCDPGAVEFIKDDGGTWVKVDQPLPEFEQPASD